jgi:uncharacterized protein with ParB-like and HNH nuclease domain
MAGTVTKRHMPDMYDLGERADFCIGEAMLHYENDDDPNPLGLKRIMGFFIPEWQRPLVWSHEQNVSLIESLWYGIPIGTYTYNRLYGSKQNNILIDGQQRMNAIELYLNDEFPVFGYRWSETTILDKRRFRHSCHFPCYITKSDDEQYLRNYYNLMNFSGTQHTEDQRA